MESSSMLLTVLCSVVALGLYSQYTEACSCMPLHPQMHFCQADFVMRAKVKGSEILYRKSIIMENGKNVTWRRAYQKVYHIRINRIFKQNDKFKNATLHKNKIYTNPSDAMCGVHLENNTKYLLTGYMHDGRAHISVCGWVGEWTRIPQKQRKGVSHLYKKNCQCKVETCIRRGDGVCPSDNSTCVWRWHDSHNSCYATSSVCEQRADGNCKWSSGKLLKECKEKNRKRARQEP
ncbi:metalloproteinase inhibitor 3 [Lingula anatina]|uniref:Metalloproteinase inhibitor 3 n=1 Tax=Lingula anatina TaxID=7574 RepID=A0A1S3JCF2_LINAN|nr:metalloproteinase inhibitor 3 [Lingula anatina]XP_013408085.1 metalloproteinase inhibitor 3 [Lingula anatina]|eukprot:XP_013408084.1 metalloproteinase inhibitor 3 [Lingula anatina]